MHSRPLDDGRHYHWGCSPPVILASGFWKRTPPWNQRILTRRWLTPRGGWKNEKKGWSSYERAAVD
jgi:hypothetical protein